MQTAHHAFLCIGTHNECLARIPLQDRSGIDVEMIAREQLEIDTARALCERAASRPIAGKKRSFIISCEKLTFEAQNALLKLFEDPPATAQFYIIAPRASALLPTLCSRLHLLYETNASKESPDERSMSFLRTSFNERLLEIATLAKEKERTKNTQTMRALIRGIESATAARIRKTEDALYLPDVLMASSYSEIRGASHKMLLEHLALSVPENLFT